MTIPATLALTLHFAAGLFWLGSSVMLARLGGAGSEKLFRPQMAAALVVFLSGGFLWSELHRGGFGLPEQVLAFGVACAVAAAGAQGALVGPMIRRLRSGAVEAAPAQKRMGRGQTVAAVLLALTLMAMMAVRYI